MSENNEKKEVKKAENATLDFIVGILLLGAGLFMLTKRVEVSSFIGYGYFTIGNFDISSGLVSVPLIIGIIWYFFNPKSFGSKILMILGGIFIVATIIMSLRIRFMSTTMYEYILMIGMSAAGAGLLLRTIANSRKN